MGRSEEHCNLVCCRKVILYSIYSYCAQHIQGQGENTCFLCHPMCLMHYFKRQGEHLSFCFCLCLSSFAFICIFSVCFVLRYLVSCDSVCFLPRVLVINRIHCKATLASTTRGGNGSRTCLFVRGNLLIPTEVVLLHFCLP